MVLGSPEQFLKLRSDLEFGILRNSFGRSCFELQLFV